MALLITDPRTEKAVIALTQATGESVDEAIANAAEARLDSISAKKSQDQLPDPKPIDMEAVYALLKQIDALPVLDHRTPDEILGYDEYGLPT